MLGRVDNKLILLLVLVLNAHISNGRFLDSVMCFSNREWLIHFDISQVGTKLKIKFSFSLYIVPLVSLFSPYLDGGPRVGLLCQFLSSLLIHLPQLVTLPPKNHNAPVRVDTLLARLNVTKTNTERVDSNTILALCGLIFQLSPDRFLTLQESHSLLSAIVTQIDPSDTRDHSELLIPSPIRLPSWIAYQVARHASRYGQHMLAANIYQSLGPQVSADTISQFYLSADWTVAKSTLWAVSLSLSWWNSTFGN